MTRGLSAAQIAEYEKANYKLAYFIEILLSTPKYYWTGVADKTVDGKTYVAAGNALSIEFPRTAQELAANGFSFTLSGIPTANLSAVLTNTIRGTTCNVRTAVLDDDLSVIGWFVTSGKADIPTISDGEGTSHIKITVENRFIDMSRPRIFRYTQDFHETTTANTDLACEYVLDLAEKRLIWGAGK